MTRSNKPNVDWEAIRERYATGETAYAIAKSLGGAISKQGIAKRAKRENWSKTPRVTKKAVTEWIHRLPDADWAGELSGRHRFTPEKGARVLEIIKEGGTFMLAAAAVGIGYRTLSDWRAASVSFARAVDNAMAMSAMRHIGVIERAATKDWKAADRQLSVNPLTRGDYGRQGPGGTGIAEIRINVGVTRPEKEQSAKTIDVTPESSGDNDE